jgi:hypothetical protein
LEEEHTELVHSIQELQIQVHGLSARMLTALEILVEQQQGQQQLQDECATIRSEVEEMRFRPSP